MGDLPEEMREAARGGHANLDALREAAQRCTACDWLMLVGEQPGDREDVAGCRGPVVGRDRRLGECEDEYRFPYPAGLP